MFLSGAFDGLSIDSASQESINGLVQLQLFTSDNLFGIPLPNLSFFTYVYNLSTFNYNMFSGDYQFMRWLLFAAFAIPTTFFFVTVIVPATMSALGFVRSLRL